MLRKIINLLTTKQNYISPRLKTFDNKVIIITGETGKIGSAIKEVLLKNGAIVVGSSPDSEVNKIDITDEYQVQKLIKDTYKKYGKIDAVINNAGLFSFGEIENISVKEFDRVTDVNIKGVFLMCKNVTPIMKLQKSGTIINIGSKISRNTKVEPKKSLYALTKYAVEGFSFALTRELKQFGIRVVCLMPGTVNTFFSRKSKDFMSVYDVAEIVSVILKMDQIDFESIVFKSKKQDI